MKKMIFTLICIALPVSSYGNFFQSEQKDQNGKNINLQVLVVPGKKPITYNPQSGELKEIKSTQQKLKTHSTEE